MAGAALQGDPALACEDAIIAAQARYGLPPGILSAIGRVESGRADPRSGVSRPWPWTIQAEGRSLYFPTKSQAVAWVADAQGRGVSLIDAGCLQVNLFFHPNAFASVSAAFDPASNADYAARFLLQLHSLAPDWATAIGYYHSRTPELAGPYQRSVQRALGGPPIPAAAQVTLLTKLAHAWQATSPAVAPEQAPEHGSSWDTLLSRRSLPAKRLGLDRVWQAEPGIERLQTAGYSQAVHSQRADKQQAGLFQERGL